MSCPYIIRENIGFGRVREHGYYQFDEMVYDLTHGFVNTDVEVIARTLYNVTMESGEELSQLDDDTVFKMLSAGLPVKYVKNARDGYITYSRPESKPVAKIKKVGGITRTNAIARPVKQYDHPIFASISDGTNWYTVAIVDMYNNVALYRFNDFDEAEKRFRSALGKAWFSATMWANNTAIFKCIEGEPIWR